MSPTFDQAYHELVRAWDRHYRLRRNGASFNELLDARRVLTEKRLAAARLRRRS